MEMYGLTQRSDLLEVSDSELDGWAELGLRDLFFFTVVICPWSRATLTGFHYDMCEFIEGGSQTYRDGGTWHGKNEVPREHFKTTFAEALILQAIAEDPSKCNLITSAVSGQAIATAEVIKSQLEHNKLYQRLYPYVVPDKSKWTGTTFRVIDRRYPESGQARREATVQCVSAGGTPESFHFDRQLHDDLVTAKNSGTPREIEKIIGFWQECQALLNSPGFDLTNGTRYADDDLYGYMESDACELDIDVFHRAVKEEEMDEDGQPTGKTYFIFPEEWNEERLEERRRLMSTKIYFANYFNDVLPVELQRFKEEFFEYFNEIPEGLCMFIGCDPSTGMGLDPCGIVVGGMDEEETIYLLEGITEMLREHEIILELDRLNLQYMPLATRIESYGPQKAILGSVEVFQKETGHVWPIEPGDGSKESKAVRVISTLQPLYERHRIKHHVSLKGSELERQLLRFGVMSADDLPDALYNMVQCARDNGYVGSSGTRKEPETPREKLDAKVPLSADEKMAFGVSVATMDAYNNRGGDGW